MSPTLTIGLPVYNGSASLGKALDSLLVQEVSDLQIIVSDNGSIDNTPEICRNYAAKHRRIRYLREGVNRGPTWNFNRLLEFAGQSPYFMWAAHDDRWASDYASSCLAFLERHSEVVLCGSAASLCDESGRLDGVVDPGYSTVGLEPVERALRFAQRVWWNSPFYGVYRSQALDGRRLENRIGGDHVFLFGLALVGAFHTLREVRMWRRVGGSSRSLKATLQTLGLRRGWPQNLREIPIYMGYFEAISRANALGRQRLGRLKRGLVGVCWRRHCYRLRRKIKMLFGDERQPPPIPE